LLPLTIGPVGHGGFCIARHEGLVVFVRHALPGERVLARVTETGRKFWRADAVEILEPAPDRVEPPCPSAGPGRCGGCDFQHVDLPAQRDLKAAVIREQFRRLAHLQWSGVVEEAPGTPDGLGWRTRVRFAVDADGRAGLFRARSAEIEVLADCPLTSPELGVAEVLARPWPAGASVQVEGAGDAVRVWATDGTRLAGARAGQEGWADLDGPLRAGEGEPAPLVQHDDGRDFQLSPGSFWQVHPAAPEVLRGVVMDMLDPKPGESALDLYAGVGLFTAALAAAVGVDGQVLAVEGAASAAADAVLNLADLPQASVRERAVNEWLMADVGQPDVVVLDPPRTGAGTAVMAALLALQPRAVAYVSCDPATLARDVAAALAAGYRLAELRAFDLFPMTAHVECVALLTPA
jgi:tRNA/tmRNA/rRNA uracil-C5-methylase (TrmA/RlmC/RlmD family)